MARATRWLMAAALVVAASCGGQPEFDVLLKGGTVVDGTGDDRFVADVAILGDQIVAVEADIPATRAREVIDIRGLVVAPGFWDNHAHLVTLEESPDAENFIRQGITTILGSLHSQDQPFPLDTYRKRVQMAPNVGLFAGHTWIRKRVMGLENRAPTTAELAWMRALVDSTMQQGALGLATGLEYVPAAYSNTDEVVALAEVAAEHGGFYSTHMRDEGVRVFESLHEVLEVGRRAEIPVQVNHLKVTGAAHWGSTDRMLAMLDSARSAGVRVAHDVYPYTAFSTYSDLMFPSWALADGPDAFALRIEDGSTRARMVDEMRVIFTQQTGDGPESIQIRNIDARPELQGRTLADYLSDQGRRTDVSEAVEALIELQLEGGFIGIFHGMSEADVERLVAHPETMFETDGDLVEPGVGFPHPRTYGSFPRILAEYVRNKGLISLEEAVRRMTSMPAAWVGDVERGTLAIDKRADLVVFDPEEIQDHAEYTDPHHYSTGVLHVFVSGIRVLSDGASTGAHPGEFLNRRQ